MIKQFDERFRKLGAYALGDVGRVVIEHTETRVTCWLQIWGAPMVKATAGGGGYDRATAAFHKARAQLAEAEGHPCPTAVLLRDSAEDESERWGEHVWRVLRVSTRAVI